MKRKTLALTLIWAIVISAVVAGIMLVNLAVANPEAYHQSTAPTILIHSPINNSAVSPNDVSINFTITKPKLGWLVSYSVPGDPERVLGNSLSSVSIIIDGKLHRTIETYSDLSSPATSYEQLTNLEDGAHNLTIKVYCEGWDLEVHGLWEYSLPYNVASDLVYFTVDSAAPFVSVLAPENKSYESTEKTLDLQFSFTVNEPVSKVTYSLDGQTNTTVAGNMSLTNLHHGEHNVTVYATDNAGNIGRSETIDFTIAKPVPESFSVMPIVVASGVFMAAVGLSLLVYFKKRKR